MNWNEFDLLPLNRGLILLKAIGHSICLLDIMRSLRIYVQTTRVDRDRHPAVLNSSDTSRQWSLCYLCSKKNFETLSNSVLLKKILLVINCEHYERPYMVYFEPSYLMTLNHIWKGQRKKGNQCMFLNMCITTFEQMQKGVYNRDISGDYDL